MHSINPQESRKQALTYLDGLGAHFVLCRRSRQPIRGFPWGSHKPALDCVLAHSSHVGIVPFSVNTSALDVDCGEPAQLSLFRRPLVAVSSRQPGREHLYYRDDTPRGNQQWRAFGCAGEVRSAKGYLILYRDAPVHLAHALAYNEDDDCYFPADLLELVEPDESAVMLDDLDIANSPQLRLLTPEAPVLERVRKGRRNIALFDAVRFWAYRAHKTDYAAWLRAVEARTLIENRRFPEPLTERHAKTTAYSIAIWTWTTYRQGFTAEQRWRGGISRGRQRRHDNRQRDVEIVQRWESGESLRLIARAVGLTEGGVRWVLRRDVQGA